MRTKIRITSLQNMVKSLSGSENYKNDPLYAVFKQGEEDRIWLTADLSGFPKRDGENCYDSVFLGSELETFEPVDIQEDITLKIDNISDVYNSVSELEEPEDLITLIYTEEDSTIDFSITENNIYRNITELPAERVLLDNLPDITSMDTYVDYLSMSHNNKDSVCIDITADKMVLFTPDDFGDISEICWIAQKINSRYSPEYTEGSFLTDTEEDSTEDISDDMSQEDIDKKAEEVIETILSKDVTERDGYLEEMSEELDDRVYLAAKDRLKNIKEEASDTAENAVEDNKNEDESEDEKDISEETPVKKTQKNSDLTEEAREAVPEDRCEACKGTGIASNGGKCRPCECTGVIKRTEEEKSVLEDISEEKIPMNFSSDNEEKDSEERESDVRDINRAVNDIKSLLDEIEDTFSKYKEELDSNNCLIEKIESMLSEKQ